jgi:hypothetical protein
MKALYVIVLIGGIVFFVGCEDDSNSQTPVHTNTTGTVIYSSGDGFVDQNGNEVQYDPGTNDYVPIPGSSGGLGTGGGTTSESSGSRPGTENSDDAEEDLGESDGGNSEDVGIEDGDVLIL